MSPHTPAPPMTRIHPLSVAPGTPRRRRWALALSCGVLLLLWATTSRSEGPVEPEESFQGRTLSQWSALLQHPNPRQRADALTNLAELGSRTLPLLTWALRDDDHTVRIATLRAIGRLGAAAQPATIPLIELLAVEEVRSVRIVAITCLGLIGPGARDALGPLQAAREGADITVRLAAETAIQKIGGETR